MFFELLSLQNGTVFVPVINGIVQSAQVQQSFFYYLIAFAGLIMAIAIHEFAHAWSAHLLGDDTAKYDDRMNINPFKHFDMFGFLLILFLNFGYGKPVPVNPNNFQNPLFGNMVVSLAGPVSNLLQAALYALLFLSLKQLPQGENFFTTFIYTLPTIGYINLALAVFNLLPVPPLDGSKIWGYFSSKVDDVIQQLAPYSLFVILLVIFPIFGNESVLSLLLRPIATAYFFILNL